MKGRRNGESLIRDVLAGEAPLGFADGGRRPRQHGLAGTVVVGQHHVELPALDERLQLRPAGGHRRHRAPLTGGARRSGHELAAPAGYLQQRQLPEHAGCV